MQNVELERLLVVLRRFEAEAAREEARLFSAALMPRPLAVPKPVRSRPAMPLEPPLLLTDIDPETEEVQRQQEAVPYTVDMEALEAELDAA
jgi:hypothetical protein